MPKIMLYPELLREKAVEIERCREEQEEIIRHIGHLMDNLISMWKGKTQQVFQAAFEARKGTYAQFAFDLRKFSLFLDRYADNMEAIDEGEIPPYRMRPWVQPPNRGY